jgi:hypothetical protein
MPACEHDHAQAVLQREFGADGVVHMLAAANLPPLNDASIQPRLLVTEIAGVASAMTFHQSVESFLLSPFVQSQTHPVADVLIEDGKSVHGKPSGEVSSRSA